MPLRVYIGHDSREERAFGVAQRTAQRFGCDVVALRTDRLQSAGLLTRPVDRRGQMYDLMSDAPQSTDFAVARFFVPLLCHGGWCLFADADVVFLEDPHELLALADESKAVQVVKHENLREVATKMDNQVQTAYARKLWSSVALWNCDHPANRRLNLTTLNQWPGRDLHAFRWLADDEIGELPHEANWLVEMQPKPDRPVVAHYTLGTPDIRPHTEHAAIWLGAEAA
jgi:lipopolysaccharide biosynthesis glycosyltransferase